MLQRVLIKDNTNLPLSYASDLETFRDGVEYKFKPGINIIVGPNGSGKSTLIRMLSMFFWCNTGMESNYEKGLGLNLNDCDRMFNEDESLRDGIVINHDYITKVFILKPYKDMKQEEDLLSIESFSLMYHSKSSSVGEGTSLSLQSLFNLMFKEGQTYDFITKKLKEKIGYVGDYWRERYKKFLKYYEENRIIPGSSEKEITVLMDEPDRNLDIFKIDDLYEVLSFHKPQTQIIASIHNPLLIYKLSEVKDINFIELEENYLYKIRRTLKDIVK